MLREYTSAELDQMLLRYREFDEFLEWHRDEIVDWSVGGCGECGTCEICYPDPLEFLTFENDTEWLDDSIDSHFSLHKEARVAEADARYCRSREFGRNRSHRTDDWRKTGRSRDSVRLMQWQ